MRWKRSIAGVLAALLLLCTFHSTVVKAADCMPMYVTTTKCTVFLSISNNTATCAAHIMGKDGTTSISGKLKLYDVTDSKAVKTWSVSKSGVSYSGSKTATVKPGHTYRLKFTGSVVDANGNKESISAKVKKTN